MNSKLCKVLRRLAKDTHIILQKPAEPGTYLQHQRNKNIICAPNSPRGLYRRLKKEIGRGPELRAKLNQVSVLPRELPTV